MVLNKLMLRKLYFKTNKLVNYNYKNYNSYDIM